MQPLSFVQVSTEVLQDLTYSHLVSPFQVVSLQMFHSFHPSSNLWIRFLDWPKHMPAGRDRHQEGAPGGPKVHTWVCEASAVCEASTALLATSSFLLLLLLSTHLLL